MNENWDKIDAFSKKTQSNIGTETDTYDNTATYTVGDVVIYGNQIYKCITPVKTAEEFDSAKWQKTSLKEMIGMRRVTETGTNLNDYDENGLFFFASSYTPTNIPAGSNGWLKVMRGASLYTKQIWYRAGTINSNDYKTYIRTRDSSGEWSSWKELIVEDNLYYKAGDTVELSNVICVGHLTSSSKQIVFSIPTDKRLDKIKTIVIKNMTVNVRHSLGDYVVNGKELTTIATVTASKATNNSIRTVVTLETASSLANNCPVGVDIRSSEIEFN